MSSLCNESTAGFQLTTAGRTPVRCFTHKNSRGSGLLILVLRHVSNWNLAGSSTSLKSCYEAYVMMERYKGARGEEVRYVSTQWQRLKVIQKGNQSPGVLIQE